MIHVKRVYEPPARSDGYRILVDRLWPRGLSKQKAHVDEWMKEVAPSPELRRWFGHDPEKWPEMKKRYRRELRTHADLVDAIARRARRRAVTLVYAARDEEHNDAVILADAVRTRMGKLGAGGARKQGRRGRPRHRAARRRPRS